jgi:hypothetical protein
MVSKPWHDRTNQNEKSRKYKERKVTKAESGAWAAISNKYSEKAKEAREKYGNNGANAVKRMWDQQKAVKHKGKYKTKELLAMIDDAVAGGFVVKRYNPDGSVKV